MHVYTIEVIDKGHSHTKYPRPLRPCSTDNVGVVGTRAVDEYLVVFLPWVVPEACDLTPRQFLSQAINAVETR